MSSSEIDFGYIPYLFISTIATIIANKSNHYKLCSHTFRYIDGYLCLEYACTQHISCTNIYKNVTKITESEYNKCKYYHNVFLPRLISQVFSYINTHSQYSKNEPNVISFTKNIYKNGELHKLLEYWYVVIVVDNIAIYKYFDCYSSDKTISEEIFEYVIIPNDIPTLGTLFDNGNLFIKSKYEISDDCRYNIKVQRY